MPQTTPARAATGGSSVRAQATAAIPVGGLAAAAAAFLIWGVFPLYLIGLTHVSALQITAHRVVWSCVFVLALLAARRELGALSAAAQRPGVLLRLAASAILVSINWLAFVWGVNHDHVVEVSLGYYINPLINVLLGILVLSERLNRAQWISVALAAAGVAYLTFTSGQLPWIALSVAVSFGLYGLIRKIVSVEALPGLAIEMMLLTPLALGYLIWCHANGAGSFGHSGVLIDVLLAVSGLVTATPLFLFSYGARQLPYSTVGILQYIAPSLQLVCAVFFLGEPFEKARTIGFSFIWLALLIYAADGLWRARQQARAARHETAINSDADSERQRSPA
jgi:chloramphenicol-sensitive protein RarD